MAVKNVSSLPNIDENHPHFSGIMSEVRIKKIEALKIVLPKLDERYRTTYGLVEFRSATADGVYDPCEKCALKQKPWCVYAKCKTIDGGYFREVPR